MSSITDGAECAVSVTVTPGQHAKGEDVTLRKPLDHVFDGVAS